MLPKQWHSFFKREYSCTAAFTRGITGTETRQEQHLGIQNSIGSEGGGEMSSTAAAAAAARGSSPPCLVRRRIAIEQQG
jgi:hypothetical protein